MTDEQLILEWNKLKNKRYNHEEITREELDAFNKMVQKSHDDGEISWTITTKYAELMCYLGTGVNE